MRFRLLAVALSICAIAAGCSSGSGSESTTLPAGVAQAPAGEAFYTPPPVPAGAKPGDLIWARPLDGPEGTKGFAILYWSQGLQGGLVPVSGIVFEPAEPADGPRAILAWGHGTFGMADRCAPSQDFLTGSGASIPLVESTVQQGLVFVSTDYRGLGTPGDHPFLVNQTAGRDILDSIRAAARITGDGTRPDSLVMGQSQGGGAVLFAAELQPTYAPDVALRGAVGISVPSDLGKLDGQLAGGSYFGYVLMTIAGYRTAYPELADDDKLLTPEGVAAVQQVEGECSVQTLDQFQNRQEAEYGAAAVLHAPDFSARLTENEPGLIRTPVPIFLVHGDQDDTIPVQNSRDLLAQACSIGDVVSAKIYPGSGHIDVLGNALGDIVPFFRDRLDGAPAPSSCTPS